MAEVTNVSMVTRELADGNENDEDDDPNSVARHRNPKCQRSPDPFRLS